MYGHVFNAVVNIYNRSCVVQCVVSETEPSAVSAWFGIVRTHSSGGSRAHSTPGGIGMFLSGCHRFHCYSHQGMRCLGLHMGWGGGEG